jgi:hypothetical protein
MNSLHRITFAVCLATSLSAMAQTEAPAPRPPQLEVLEEGPPPTISNTPSGEAASGNRIEEHRRPDGSTEVKVNAGPSTYYVKPGKDGTGEPVTRAQWKIKEFEAGGSKTKDGAADKPAP